MLTRQRQKEIASLAQRKYRQRFEQAILEGQRAVQGAIDSGAPLVEVVLTHDAAVRPDVRVMRSRISVPVHEVSATVMSRLGDVATSQGILAVVRMRWAELENLAHLERVLVLDGVQDPGNVGTLIRTAAWFGIGGVLFGPGSADPYAPKVLRATMGAVWDVQLARAAHLPSSIDDLRRLGMTIYSADLDGLAASSWSPTLPSALVLGNEAHGVSAEVRSRIDFAVTIPGARRGRAIESLNVATAGTVLMYQWTR